MSALGRRQRFGRRMDDLPVLRIVRTQDPPRHAVGTLLVVDLKELVRVATRLYDTAVLELIGGLNSP